ncbi:2-hydroxyacyl-CoA dehydratase family protein [Candidatus Cloacimonadota bacterium]
MKIGFTTSFPVEIVFAAGHYPIDLNNIFVTGNAQEYVEEAEFKGFPRNVCAWIKGLYSVAIEAGVDEVVGVTQGDCSNTHSLMSTLNDKQIPIIPFSFPYDKDKGFLQKEISKLEQYFAVSHQEVLDMKQRLDLIRRKLITVDELTWKQNKVSGLENHFWLVNSSDFNGDPDDFEKRLDEFILEASNREPLQTDYLLAYLGVPPIISDLYDFLLENKVNVTFNEIQRQFSMPFLEKDIFDQYLRYTYPYSVFDRLDDINSQLQIRRIDGVISYSQAFCHRQIDNILLKKYIEKPFLTIEADQPGPLDARTKLRIESFLDMLRY